MTRSRGVKNRKATSSQRLLPPLDALYVFSVAARHRSFTRPNPPCAIDHTRLWIFGETVGLSLKFPRKPEIVSIEKCDPLTARFKNASIAGCSGALVELLDQRHLREVAAYNGRRVVG